MPVKLPLIPDTAVTRVSAELPGAQPRSMEYASLVRELLLKQRLVTGVLIDVIPKSFTFMDLRGISWPSLKGQPHKPFIHRLGQRLRSPFAR